MRLIDADEIKYTDMLSSKGNGNYEHVGMVTQGEIDALPTVDAVPVRHGEWISKSTGGEHFDCCSECGYVEWDAPNKYCPNCGAKMDVAERKEK